MWWYKPFVVACALLVLQACGFQPLYQQTPSGGAGRAFFETIKVPPIADRVGQELRNHLYSELTPKGQPADPKWELVVKLTESIQKTSIERTSFSTRANLVLTGTYTLTPLDADVVGLSGETAEAQGGASDAAVGHSGTVKVTSSYNIFDSEYATLVAERDSRSRAVLFLSNDIRRQLAIWYNNRSE